MPTILDTLALELQLDPKQFETGLKSVTEQVRVNRGDLERHATALEGVFASLFRAISPIATAFIGLGTAIAALDFSKHAAAVTTEFSAMASVIGLSVEQLSAWTQAAEAAAQGGGKALTETFHFQQQQFQNLQTGQGGPEAAAFLGGLQHYGLDIQNYRDAKTNAIDVERLSLDIAEATKRIDKSNAEASQYLSRLGIRDSGLQTFFRGGRAAIEAQIKYQKEAVGTLTKTNADAMKQLQADWANLASAANNLKVQLVTRFLEPLSDALERLRKTLTFFTAPPGEFPSQLYPSWMQNLNIKEWWKRQTTPQVIKPGETDSSPPATQPPPASAVTPPAQPPPASPRVVTTPPATSTTSVPRPSSSQPLPAWSTDPMSGASLSGPPPVSSGPPSLEVPVAPLAGVPYAAPQSPPVSTPMPVAPGSVTTLPPAPALPVPVPTPPSATSEAQPSSTVTQPPPAPPPAPAISSEPPPPPSSYQTPGGAIMVLPQSGRRTSVPSIPAPASTPMFPLSSPEPQPAIAPQSFLETPKSYMMDLSRLASSVNQSSIASPPSMSTTNNSNVTIGSMSFHATTNDAMLGYAPSGSERTLAIGAYSVEANTSLI